MSLEATKWAFDQLKAKDLSDPEKLLLLVIADIAQPEGDCWPSTSYLADMLGKAPRTIRLRLATLEDKGLLFREQRRRANGSMTSNLYQLAMPEPDRTEVAREMKPTHLYAAQVNDRIKIGISSNPEKRVERLGAQSAYAVKLLGTARGGRTQEDALHQRLEEHRVRGEWFQDVPEVRAEIEKTLQITGGNKSADGKAPSAPEPSVVPVPLGKQTTLEQPPKLRKKVLVAGRPISEDEWKLASGILRAFNEANGSDWKALRTDGHASENLKRIVMRLREFDEYSLDDHREIIRKNFAAPWWKEDRPGSVAVIYGPNAFPRAAVCTGKRPTNRRTFKDERPAGVGRGPGW